MTAGIGAADAAIYTGVCLENVDPTGAGRVRYCVPQLSGAQSFGWAKPVVQGVTAVGATIYVAFEGGDRNRPLFWPAQPVPQTPYVPPYQMKAFSGSGTTSSSGGLIITTGATFTAVNAFVMYDQTFRSSGPFCSAIWYDPPIGQLGTQWMNGTSVINAGVIYYRGMVFG